MGGREGEGEDWAERFFWSGEKGGSPRSWVKLEDSREVDVFIQRCIGKEIGRRRVRMSIKRKARILAFLVSEISKVSTVMIRLPGVLWEVPLFGSEYGWRVFIQL